MRCFRPNQCLWGGAPMADDASVRGRRGPEPVQAPSVRGIFRRRTAVSHIPSSEFHMRGILIALVLTGSLAATSAEAAGCLRGAALGGVAGHFAGRHPILGAIVGCVVGRTASRVYVDHVRVAPQTRVAIPVR